MLAAPPSLQREYTLCFSGDPALDLPEIPAEGTEGRDAVIEDRNHKLKVARETGNWPIKPGQRATYFRFRQVGGSAVRWWFGESQRGQLSPLEDIELMFRLALVDVDNLDGVTVKHDDRGKFPLVTLKAMDEIYASGAGAACIYELGTVVAERALGGVPPL